MKDFDIIRAERVNADRRVKLGGEVLTFRASVAADVMAEWWDSEHESEVEALAATDRFILKLLEPGQDDAWRRVRSPDQEIPVTNADLREFVLHVLEVMSGRPTERPSGSTGTRSATGTESKAEDSSPEGTA